MNPYFLVALEFLTLRGFPFVNDYNVLNQFAECYYEVFFSPIVELVILLGSVS